MEKTTKLSDFLETFYKEAFLQSEQWRAFQESEGKKTHHFEEISKAKDKDVVFKFWANIIEHMLPVVGKYFYIPRGPVIRGRKEVNLTRVDDTKKALAYLVWLAKDNGAGWVRFDPRSDKDLNLIKEAILKMSKEKKVPLKKAPHDMQPKEIFVVDISKSEQELLSEMKSKTRYNIRLAEKKGVVISCPQSVIDRERYLEEFLKLNRETAERDGIVTHPDEHYRKMAEIFPEDIFRIYVAEYQGKIIAANLVVFFEDTAIYLHGASSNENRDVMAPYLLQWKQMSDAKEKGCKYYDFGGIKTGEAGSWQGITRFKTGFSPRTEPLVFPGSYDIVVNCWKYNLYRGLQKAKEFLRKIRK
ncbi:MAG TPA: hypothetical protein DCX32_01615 [Candidatus Moranbacteria bacterium]|nr:MAG: Methicillin resistance protein [Candidatus Moranbacteria bacterium GW2011_GWC2_45_10]KKT94519.1 MAG: Methicillin resistance protein [Parcubacteria group bacterium GW2011_GWC1_45_14]HAV11219.1 hypothetical protein [Candidatus Moranbacteria bacterium]